MEDNYRAPRKGKLIVNTKKHCECGHCHDLIDMYDKKGRYRRYKYGHQVWAPRTIHKGINHYKYKEKKKNSGGYIVIGMPDHPRANNHGNVREHILVMEQIIGRSLEDNEIVHHKNGVKTDNRPENLQLMTISEHKGLHMTERHEKYRTDITSKRKCSNCDSNTTYYHKKRKNIMWCKDPRDKNKIVCFRCCNRIRWRLKHGKGGYYLP